jgi:elongation factor P--beta-lysine ligase
MLPLCWGTAAGVDRVVDLVVDRISVRRGTGRE